MRSLRAVVLLILVLLAVPLFSAEKNVYFSLSTDKTYLPTEKPHVRLYAQNVDALEFRVYRVNDPVVFFEKLKDVHSFGPQTSMKENIDEETWIERFHDWKQDHWIEIRDFFRHQYSAESRAAIRDWHSGKAQRSNVTGASQFAQVPLLNSSQLVARWKVNLPPKYVSESSDLPVESLPAGAYLIEATDGEYKAYSVLLISQVGLITKTSPGRVLAFTADRSTGAPVAECKVSIYHDKKIATTLVTNKDGIAETTFEAKPAKETSAGEDGEEIDSGDGSDWALGQCGKNVAMVAPYTLNLSSYPGRDWLGYVYTDRPVYRPGHTVYFKAILRKRNGDIIQLPSDKQVEATIEGPDQKKLMTSQFTVSPFGTLSGSLEIPTSAALGYYSVTVTNGKGSVSGSFFVEEYKKPEYLVKVTPDVKRVLQGNSFKATIEARYYFGEPVANAKVTYVVHTSRAYTWGDEDEDSEEGDSEEADQDNYFYGEQVMEEHGKLDANGKLVVTIPTKIQDKEKVDVNYRVEARVTDEANREISGTNAVLATYANYHLNVRAQSWVYQQNDTAQVTVGAFDYDKKPVQTQVTLELTKYRYGQSDDALLTLTGQTGADGNAHFSVPLKEAGSFRFRAKSRTSDGREPTATSWVWVAGAEEESWGEGEARQIQIIPDKPSYKVGDKARVLIQTGMPDTTVLVTTEGHTVITRQIVKVSGTNITLELPITKEDQPNVYVSAAFLHNNQFYQGNKNVKVPAVEQKLNIDIQPAKQTFQPGEGALYNVTVKDATGKPVSAELSFGVVDDAIYAVRPDSSGNILSAFYEPRYYSSVSTENSLSFYFHGEAGRKSMELAGYGSGNGGGAGGGRYRALAQVKNTDFVQPKIRKAFPDTALWMPTVHTDASGKATVRVNFPDSLTTWRTTVRAITLDTKAGASINRVLVRKNVMARLVVPRFFRQGDEVTISTIVHNYLDSAKTARVSLDVTGLDMLQGQTTDVNVPSKGDVKVDFRVRAQNGTEAKILTKALTNEESDAMELTLPIVPFGVKQAVAQSGVIIDANGQANASIVYPASEASSRSMDVEMSPSVAGAIFSALNYLTSFPYGCTEQTMSSFLPNVVVASAMKDLGVKSNVDPDSLKRKVQAGLDRLYDFQHDDGGWGWWKEDDSMVFMTAYVVSGLSQASAAGYDVKPDVITKGKTFLNKQLKDHPRMIPDLRAYVVYALAVSGDRNRDAINVAWDKKSKLSSQGIAMVGIAMKIEGDGRVGEAAQMLEGMVKYEGDGAYWPSNFDPLLELYYDDSVEATAHAVKFLSTAKPDSPLLPKAVQWMMRHREDGYYWETTKQTAMVLYGVTDYLRVSKELQADFAAEASVNGKQVLSRKFTAADTTSGTAPSIHLGSAAVAPSNALNFKKSGVGRLYWSVNAPYYSTDKKLFKSGNLELNIYRDYYRLIPNKTGDKIVYDLQAVSGPVNVGDVLAVHVVVAGGEWKYLLMEDPIPAGTEFIQRDDLYEVKQKPSWWTYWFSRREFHDDRAAIFQTYFDKRHEYFYLLKVVNPGKFRISPASVQPMYQPSVLATSEPATLEVQ